ncbi:MULTISPECIES: hypothetical protein [Streptomyces]|uniref:Uncharacterized protein n=2 Tax=Streptomyces TaxID=1883 RepID=A0A2U9NWS3_STRAS|nr:MULTISPECIES: hypothetical protein [Streptomyces]AWT41315.1 hypothetical protein DMT42_02630 [Streptomyces actuosus]MBM4826141.1 hypothetical protein [Streptomyces actuosus]GHF53876.1 hypothetical protein GCM10018783_23500 [Streptomyces griseosporeus]
MDESELPPDERPVDVYLDLLRLRMDSEDYRLLLDVVQPVLRAIDQQRLAGLDLVLESGAPEDLPQEIRDEAALVIATAVTGRLDNQLVEIDVDGADVRVVTDSVTAGDPASLDRIAEHLRRRRHDTEELRGIAEASGLPTDF